VGATAASGWAEVMRELAAPVISRSPGLVADVARNSTAGAKPGLAGAR